MNLVLHVGSRTQACSLVEERKGSKTGGIRGLRREGRSDPYRRNPWMHSKSAVWHARILSAISTVPPARSLRGRCILGMRITRGGILGALYATPWFNCFPFAVRLRARDDDRRFGLSANARCHTNC